MSYSATLVANADSVDVGKIGLSGGNSIRVYTISPDAATGNFTVSDVDKVFVLAVTPLVEDTDGSGDNITVQALENSTTENQVDCKIWNAANTAATTFKDFRVTLLCIG